jgi:hypothetical protein
MNLRMPHRPDFHRSADLREQTERRGDSEENSPWTKTEIAVYGLIALALIAVIAAIVVRLS